MTVLMASPGWPEAPGRRIVEQGSGSGAPACMSCHGASLQGTPSLGVPPLAGLPAAFVLARLAHYAGPDGHNAEMRAVASALSASDRQAVADYVASLPTKAAEAQPAAATPPAHRSIQ